MTQPSSPNGLPNGLPKGSQAVAQTAAQKRGIRNTLIQLGLIIAVILALFSGN